MNLPAGPKDPYNALVSDDVLSVNGDLAEQLESLGGQLVWRVGKHEVGEEIVVRLGYASRAPRFAQLPRLHGASDAEIRAALERGQIVIEWVD